MIPIVEEGVAERKNRTGSTTKGTIIVVGPASVPKVQGITVLEACKISSINASIVFTFCSAFPVCGLSSCSGVRVQVQQAEEAGLLLRNVK